MTPELSEATLQADEVASLLRDVEALGVGLAVRIKRVAAGYAQPTRHAVADVAPALEQGCAVQLRYRFEAQDFIDTLLPLAGGRARLVRTAAP